jgi:alkylated DNA repair dioxygenase AlkB
MRQSELFAAPVRVPEGARYAADFLSLAGERELLQQIRTLSLQQAEYKQWRARRRVTSFGGRYDFSRNELIAAPAIPEFLHDLRARAAAWAHLAVAKLEQALVAEYQPGTPLGWHRDVSQFEEIIGVSLLGHARLRFRPWPPAPAQRTVFAIELARRSIYLLRGAARWHWQHAVSPTNELRYSITLRTWATGARARWHTA